MIQIRNVPDDLHRTLKARAATEGMSLSDYLLRELRQLTAQPTPAEFLERLRQREPVKLRVPSRHYSRDAWAVIVLDASVVVELLLAETLRVTLVTRDRRLAQTRGHRARIDVV